VSAVIGKLFVSQLRQLCEVEACCEEAVFVCNVAREHQAGKPFIPGHVPASMSPQFELAHWRAVAGNLLSFQNQVRAVSVVNPSSGAPDDGHVSLAQLESGKFGRMVELLEESETNPGLCAVVKTSTAQLKRLHAEAAWNGTTGAEHSFLATLFTSFVSSCVVRCSQIPVNTGRSLCQVGERHTEGLKCGCPRAGSHAGHGVVFIKIV
jgi:hypothetical protein